MRCAAAWQVRVRREAVLAVSTEDFMSQGARAWASLGAARASPLPAAGQILPSFLVLAQSTCLGCMERPRRGVHLDLCAQSVCRACLTPHFMPSPWPQAVVLTERKLYLFDGYSHFYRCDGHVGPEANVASAHLRPRS